MKCKILCMDDQGNKKEREIPGVEGAWITEDFITLVGRLNDGGCFSELIPKEFPYTYKIEVIPE
ncbi:MAG: hypothetical protein GF311_26675 [Candidatus Lokiarchaeota archaeon]|nr:hypothetical protein [Candidatus Lokiarchaeota archaeon]